jgi:glycine/D-amino acid oxidase-like deaminating enzyme
VNVGVVGAGIFGLSTALALARTGARVTVFDRRVPPAEDAASTDRTKALRFEYGGASPLYAPLVHESRAAYRALEQGRGLGKGALYEECGVLTLARSFDEGTPEWMSWNYLVEHGYAIEAWEPAAARARFAHFKYEDVAAVTWNPEGGYVRAARAARAAAEAAREAGAIVVAPARVEAVDEHPGAAEVRLETGEKFAFDAVCVCAGAWFSRLVASPAEFVRPMAQFVTYYRPPNEAAAAAFRPPAFCVWLYDRGDASWYGMPLDDGVLKVARHHGGVPADPDAQRAVTDENRAQSRDFVTHSVPAIDPGWYADDLGCLYAMTGDGNFVIDRIPGRARLFAAGGGSGHGFKLGPAVGRLAAELVISGHPTIAAFRFDAVRDGRVT